MPVSGACYANPLLQVRSVRVLFAVVIVLYAKYWGERREASARHEGGVASEYGCRPVTVRVVGQG